MFDNVNSEIVVDNIGSYGDTISIIGLQVDAGQIVNLIKITATPENQSFITPNTTDVLKMLTKVWFQ